MEIMYYMPLYLKKVAAETGNPDLLDFCEIFKILNINASVLDRTNVIKPPFAFHNMHPIPLLREVKPFDELCIDRAKYFLQKNKPITLMYSGGLDSSVVLVAFSEALKQGVGSYDQITVAATQTSIVENPQLWNELVLPTFRLGATSIHLKTMHEDTLYIQGENADQMFGSDQVFYHPWMLTEPFNNVTLSKYLTNLQFRPKALERFYYEIQQLVLLCPRPIDTFADFMWWFNFTQKWQSVGLRSLSFSNLFANGGSISLNQLESYNTFFNTEDFQISSMTTLEQWGLIKTAKTYKMDERKFLLKYAKLDHFCSNKIKVGSLLGVLINNTYPVHAFGLDTDGMVRGANLWDMFK